jgi:hypothetical protein
MFCNSLQILPGLFHIQIGQVSGGQGQHPKKLLEIGEYLNKGYHVFVGTYLMSVPLVHHLHQLNTYITGTVWRTGNFYPSSSRTNLQFDKKCIADLVPFLHVFSMRRNHKRIILSSISPARPHAKKRKYEGGIMAIHK